MPFNQTNTVFNVNYKKITTNGATIHGDEKEVHGNRNIITGKRCTVYGHRNEVKGDFCKVRGNRNIILGNSCDVIGDSNDIKGNDCATEGNNNCVTGTGARIRGNVCMNSGSAVNMYSSGKGDMISTSSDMFIESDDEDVNFYGPICYTEKSHPHKKEKKRVQTFHSSVNFTSGPWNTPFKQTGDYPFVNDKCVVYKGKSYPRELFTGEVSIQDSEMFIGGVPLSVLVQSVEDAERREKKEHEDEGKRKMQEAEEQIKKLSAERERLMKRTEELLEILRDANVDVEKLGDVMAGTMGSEGNRNE